MDVEVRSLEKDIMHSLKLLLVNSNRIKLLIKSTRVMVWYKSYLSPWIHCMPAETYFNMKSLATSSALGGNFKVCNVGIQRPVYTVQLVQASIVSPLCARACLHSTPNSAVQPSAKQDSALLQLTMIEKMADVHFTRMHCGLKSFHKAN